MTWWDRILHFKPKTQYFNVYNIWKRINYITEDGDAVDNESDIDSYRHFFNVEIVTGNDSYKCDPFTLSIHSKYLERAIVYKKRQTNESGIQKKVTVIDIPTSGPFDESICTSRTVKFLLCYIYSKSSSHILQQITKLTFKEQMSFALEIYQCASFLLMDRHVIDFITEIVFNLVKLSIENHRTDSTIIDAHAMILNKGSSLFQDQERCLDLLCHFISRSFKRYRERMIGFISYKQLVALMSNRYFRVSDDGFSTFNFELCALQALDDYTSTHPDKTISKKLLNKMLSADFINKNVLINHPYLNPFYLNVDELNSTLNDNELFISLEVSTVYFNQPGQLFTIVEEYDAFIHRDDLVSGTVVVSNNKNVTSIQLNFFSGQKTEIGFNAVVGAKIEPEIEYNFALQHNLRMGLMECIKEVDVWFDSNVLGAIRFITSHGRVLGPYGTPIDNVFQQANVSFENDKFILCNLLIDHNKTLYTQWVKANI